MHTRPTTCSACLLALANKIGAEYVAIGQVHKLSKLLIQFPVQIYDVGTGRVVFTSDMKTDGAYTNSMWRHIANDIASRIDGAAL